MTCIVTQTRSHRGLYHTNEGGRLGLDDRGHGYWLYLALLPLFLSVKLHWTSAKSTMLVCLQLLFQSILLIIQPILLLFAPTYRGLRKCFFLYPYRLLWKSGQHCLLSPFKVIHVLTIPSNFCLKLNHGTYQYSIIHIQE